MSSDSPSTTEATSPAATDPSERWAPMQVLESARGSRWRMWDLHIHAPGTKLSDAYGATPDWDRYCRILEESPVAAVGITDYFSFDGFFEVVAQHAERYPKSKKVLFPNLELRLNESVNAALQTVDAHLLLRPTLDRDAANRLLQALTTEIAEPNTGRRLTCAELATPIHFKSATVTRDAIDEAVATTFGTGRHRRDNVIMLVPANNAGIRASSSEARKANLADAIDRGADAIFGSDANSGHFLREDRFEDGSRSRPKPVFSGCDAHSFSDLESWLGKHVQSQSTYQIPTWIKADVTFEGLQQTLVEPDERVRIQATQPDVKDAYKVISKLTFEAPDTFPSEVLLNENLVTIIGSRSSGKSALLAYIAHAVDPEYAIDQQMATGQLERRGDAGPAAGHTWAEVASLKARVEWQDAAVTTGKIIYIPQNSLFSLSSRPRDITAKIVPALYRLSDGYRVAHEQAVRTLEAANGTIAREVAAWFRSREEVATIQARIRDLGDRGAVESTKVSIDAQIDQVRKEASLSDSDVAAFESLAAALRTMEARIAAISGELLQLAPYVDESADGASVITANVRVEVEVQPPPDELSPAVAEVMERLRAEARTELLGRVAKAFIEHRDALVQERDKLNADKAQLELSNADLIARNRASVQLDELLKRQAEQVATLTAIDAESALVASARESQSAHARAIEEAITARQDASRPLAEAFSSLPNDLDGLSFGFEEAIEDEVVELVSNRFNKLERSTFVDSSARVLDVSKAQAQPAAFLEAIGSGSQKLVKAADQTAAAAEALTATRTIRFFARLDGDRIGGFERSSMTPGKQALFALTLTLSESAEAWPLLIDQPEDDLDSRAIYDTIVPYLKRRKRERQIVMVTHNANLAVGADSEQVIVTNRHGTDRQNRYGRTFAYLSGSLEHGQPRKETPIVLEQCGVREHTCEILDGGEEAFEKRRDKYKMY